MWTKALLWSRRLVRLFERTMLLKINGWGYISPGTFFLILLPRTRHDCPTTFFFFHFIMILLELRKYLLMPFLSFFYSFLIIVLQLVPIINLSSISVFRFFFFLVCFLLFEKFINQVIWSTYWLISLSKIYWYLSLIIKAIIMKWTSYVEILSLKNIIFVQCTI